MIPHKHHAVTPVFTHLALGAWGLVALLVVANVAVRINEFAAIAAEDYKVPESRHQSQAQSRSISPSPVAVKAEEPALTSNPGIAPMPEIVGTITPAQQVPVREDSGTLPPAQQERVPELPATSAPQQSSGNLGLEIPKTIVPQPASEVGEKHAPFQEDVQTPSDTLETIAPAQPRARPIRQAAGTIATHAASAEANRNKKPVTREAQPAEKRTTPFIGDRYSISNY
jgi:hypothetical protein